MRSGLYDAVGIGFLLGSGYFFYRTIGFLMEADYVAALLSLAVAFLVVRTGVDLSRLAMAQREESDE